MADFPTFANITEDSSLWDMNYEDDTLRAPTDGGYEFTRPRSTRRQRRIISSGYTALSQLQNDAMYAFYNTHKTSVAFNYTIPMTGEVITVRFAEPISHKWDGVALTPLWNVKFKFKEV